MANNFEVASNSDFRSNQSPAEINFKTLLGTNANHIIVHNDGVRSLGVEMSRDGVVFGPAHEVKREEEFEMKDVNVAAIRIVWMFNSAYRVVFVED